MPDMPQLSFDGSEQENRYTHAPLYWATSSPKMNTLGFFSISSAIASLSASRTVSSLTPDSVA